MLRLVLLVTACLGIAAGSVAGEHGRMLYLEHCASCHGDDLEGQPDWRERNEAGRLPAPPHDETGHTWHHSDRQLLVLIRDGLESIAPGYETDMPAYGDTLADGDILAILDYFKSRWPDDVRQFQRARSASDPMD